MLGMKLKNRPHRPLRVVESPAPLNPEYLRISRIPQIYGLSRSHVWLRIADETLESIHVKAPNAKRGVRLVSVASLKKYLATFTK